MPRSSKEEWTTTHRSFDDEEEVLEGVKPGPKSWKVKQKKEEETSLDGARKEITDVDDLLLSASDGDTEDEKSGEDNLNETEKSSSAELDEESDPEDDDNIVLESSNLLETRELETTALNSAHRSTVNPDQKPALSSALNSERNPAPNTTPPVSAPVTKEEMKARDPRTRRPVRTEVNATPEDTAAKQLSAPVNDGQLSISLSQLTSPPSADDGPPAVRNGSTAETVLSPDQTRGRDSPLEPPRRVNSPRPGGKAECRICGLILAQGRLASHEGTPHPVPCTHTQCTKMFILEKSMERHKKTAHAQFPQKSRLVLQCQVESDTHEEDKDSVCTDADRTEDEMDEQGAKEVDEQGAKEVNKALPASQEIQRKGMFNKEKDEKENKEESSADNGKISDDEEEDVNVEMEEEGAAGETADDDSIDPEVGPFICKFCKEEFKTWSILTRHFITPHLFKCKFCTLAFNRQTTMEDHVNLVHDLVGQIDSTQCQLCGESFTRPSTLARHIQLPHDFECRKCERKWTTLVLLRKHTAVCPKKHLKLDDEGEEPDGRKKGKRRSGDNIRGKRGKKKIDESASDGNEETPGKKRRLGGKIKRKLSADSVQSVEEEARKSVKKVRPSGRGKGRVSATKNDVESEKESDAEPKSKKKKKKILNKKQSTDSNEFVDSEEGEEDTKPQSKQKAGRKRIVSEHSETSSEERENETPIKRNNKAGNKIKRKQSLGEDKSDTDEEESEQGSESSDDMNLSQRLKNKQDVPSAKRTSPTKKIKLAAEEVEDELDDGKLDQSNLAAATNNSVVCDLCGMQFSKLSIKRHMGREHKFKCLQCNKRFLFKAKLNLHAVVHSQTAARADEQECADCGFTPIHVEGRRPGKAMEDHLSTPHRFPCTDCHMKFTSTDRQSVHGWTMHESELPSEFKCFHCEDTFSNEDGNVRIVELESHVDRTHRRECDKCGDLFAQEDDHFCSPSPTEEDGSKMLDEISDEYPVMEALTTLIDPKECVETTCRKCGTEFDRPELARKHLSLPHPYDCNECALHFISEPRLRYHTIILHNVEDQIKTSCVHCDISFPQIIQYLDHFETPHKHTCDDCEKKFVDTLSLEKHMRLVHPVVLICRECSMDFTGRSSEYQEHKNTKHRFQCFVCEASYIKQQQLSQHLETVHAEAEAKCRQCGLVENDWTDLEAHVKQPHRIPCPNCGMMFREKEEKDKHALDAHNVVKGLDLRCGKCEEEFEDTTKFRDHFKLPHPYPCSQCDNKYPTSQGLATHVSLEHDKQDKLVCDMCKKKFGTLEKKLYAEHIEKQHTFECEACGSAFIKAAKLKEHIEDRHGKSKHFDEKYTCKLCGTVCSRGNDSKLSREALNKHVSIPHKFPCKSCNFRFANKTKLEAHFLESHVNSASGVKSSECSICGTHFSDAVVLRDHKKRPHNHACHNTKCKRKFISESALEKHLQRKHKEFAAAKLQGGKIVFPCRQCDLPFEHPLALQSHSHVEHKQLCHMCDKQFVQADQLMAHLRTKHNVQRIPEKGFRCSLCGTKYFKMADVRMHRSMVHRYTCNHCSHRFVSKPELEDHREETHSDSVGVATLEAGREGQQEASLERRAGKTNLGANLRYWTESKFVREYLHRAMAGKTDSFRHKMFLDAPIRQITIRYEDSDLYKMSNPRYLCLPANEDKTLIDAILEIYKSGPPVPCPAPGLEYIFCVLVPELWILYLTHFKKLSRSQADQKYKKEMELDTAESEWQDFDRVISDWRAKTRDSNAAKSSDPEVQIVDSSGPRARLQSPGGNKRPRMEAPRGDRFGSALVSADGKDPRSRLVGAPAGRIGEEKGGPLDPRRRRQEGSTPSPRSDTTPSKPSRSADGQAAASSPRGTPEPIRAQQTGEMKDANPQNNREPRATQQQKRDPRDPRGPRPTTHGTDPRGPRPSQSEIDPRSSKAARPRSPERLSTPQQDTALQSRDPRSSGRTQQDTEKLRDPASSIRSSPLTPQQMRDPRRERNPSRNVPPKDEHSRVPNEPSTSGSNLDPTSPAVMNAPQSLDLQDPRRRGEPRNLLKEQEAVSCEAYDPEVEDARSLSENYAQEEVFTTATAAISISTLPEAPPQPAEVGQPAVAKGVDPQTFLQLQEKLAQSVHDPESFWNLSSLGLPGLANKAAAPENQASPPADSAINIPGLGAEEPTKPFNSVFLLTAEDSKRIGERRRSSQDSLKEPRRSRENRSRSRDRDRDSSGKDRSRRRHSSRSRSRSRDRRRDKSDRDRRRDDRHSADDRGDRRDNDDRREKSKSINSRSRDNHRNRSRSRERGRGMDYRSNDGSDQSSVDNQTRSDDRQRSVPLEPFSNEKGRGGRRASGDGSAHSSWTSGGPLPPVSRGDEEFFRNPDPNPVFSNMPNTAVPPPNFLMRGGMPQVRPRPPIFNPLVRRNGPRMFEPHHQRMRGNMDFRPRGHRGQRFFRGDFRPRHPRFDGYQDRHYPEHRGESFQPEYEKEGADEEQDNY